MNNKQIMALAAQKANITMNLNEGGPFGAAIVKNNNIVCVVSNSVLKDNDPTAHAEINAIRKASKLLNTYDLSECVLYATGYPCPMCLAAIVWANIKKVYVCNEVALAEDIGFRDVFIYEILEKLKNNINVDILDIEYLKVAEGDQLYKNYENMNKEIY